MDLRCLGWPKLVQNDCLYCVTHFIVLSELSSSFAKVSGALRRGGMWVSSLVASSGVACYLDSASQFQPPAMKLQLHKGDAIFLKIVASPVHGGGYSSYIFHDFVTKTPTHWISHYFFFLQSFQLLLSHHLGEGGYTCNFDHTLEMWQFWKKKSYDHRHSFSLDAPTTICDMSIDYAVNQTYSSAVSLGESGSGEASAQSVTSGWGKTSASSLTSKNRNKVFEQEEKRIQGCH